MRNEHQAGWVPGLVTEANQDLLLETLMTAEQVFAGEQAHDSVALVVRGGEVLRVLEIYGEDAAAKQVQMVRLAMQIEEDAADALILVGEYWSAPIDKLASYERPSESYEKTECLAVMLLQQDGAAIEFSAPIERDGEDAWLGAWKFTEDLRSFSLTPVHIGWGHPVPDAWRAMTLQLLQEAEPPH